MKDSAACPQTDQHVHRNQECLATKFLYPTCLCNDTVIFIFIFVILNNEQEKIGPFVDNGYSSANVVATSINTTAEEQIIF